MRNSTNLKIIQLLKHEIILDPKPPIIPFPKTERGIFYFFIMPLFISGTYLLLTDNEIGWFLYFLTFVGFCNWYFDGIDADKMGLTREQYRDKVAVWEQDVNNGMG